MEALKLSLQGQVGVKICRKVGQRPAPRGHPSLDKGGEGGESEAGLRGCTEAVWLVGRFLWKEEMPVDPAGDVGRGQGPPGLNFIMISTWQILLFPLDRRSNGPFSTTLN